MPLIAIVVLLGLGAMWAIYELDVVAVTGYAIEATLLTRGLIRYGISLLPRWNGMSPALWQVP